MNILSAYHAQNVDTCKWVLENTLEDTDNITVQLWREACKEFLANHSVLTTIHNKYTMYVIAV